MCSFWSGDATIIMKQAAAVGLFKTMKGVFTTAGGVHDSLKKEFTPEGLLLGYNTMYFDDPQGEPAAQAVRRASTRPSTTSTRPTSATTPTSTPSPTRRRSRRRLRRLRPVAGEGAGGQGARGHRGRVALRQAQLARGPRADVQLLPGHHHPQEQLRLRDHRPDRGGVDQAGHEARRAPSSSTGSTTGRA